MVTFNQLIYDLWEIIEPTISDDSNFDKRQLAFWIKNQRANLIRNELNKNRTIDDDIIQDLGCIGLEVADAADCCSETDGCKVLRTVQKIPNAIELHNKPAITRVAPINKLDIPFNFVDYERAIYSGNGRFNSKQIFAFLLNGYIYIKSKDMSITKYLTDINVRGVFEDPEDATKFVDCDNQPCFSYDSEFPIKRWMVDFMKSNILQLNIIPATQAVDDGTNNAKADNTHESA